MRNSANNENRQMVTTGTSTDNARTAKGSSRLDIECERRDNNSTNRYQRDRIQTSKHRHSLSAIRMGIDTKYSEYGSFLARAHFFVCYDIAKRISVISIASDLCAPEQAERRQEEGGATLLRRAVRWSALD